MNTSETINEIATALNYNSDTGHLVWNKKMGARGLKGSIAGNVDINDGYVRIKHNDTIFLAHRIIWHKVNGCVNGVIIDHINHNRADNRLSNLRVTNNSGNQKNSSPKKNNTSGIMGVRKRKDNNKWTAQINNNKRQLHLGQFDDFFEACCARKSGQNIFMYHENHGRQL